MAIQFDMGNLGSIDLDETLRLAVQCRNGSGVVTAPDSAPTWYFYSTSDTPIHTGSLGSSDADSKTGYRTGNVSITAANGFAAGGRYNIYVTYDISSTTYSSLGVLQVT